MDKGGGGRPLARAGAPVHEQSQACALQDGLVPESQLSATACVPGAAQHGVVRCRPGTAQARCFSRSRISSAPRECALHCVRDTNQAAVKASASSRIPGKVFMLAAVVLMLWTSDGRA